MGLYVHRNHLGLIRDGEKQSGLRLLLVILDHSGPY